MLASLIPGNLIFAIQYKNQRTFVAKNMQVIIYIVLALISIKFIPKLKMELIKVPNIRLALTDHTKKVN